MLFVALGIINKSSGKAVKFVKDKHPRKAKPAEKLHSFSKVKSDVKVQSLTETTFQKIQYVSIRQNRMGDI